MKKTGEAYTDARAQILKPAPASPRAAAPVDYARLAGKSDATIEASTGCTWDRWVRTLDRAGALGWTHREIAMYVSEKFKIPGWWAQSVTVGYERIKGLRAVGQRRDGAFQTNKSRTFAVPLARLYRAFHDPRLRARWLPGVKLTVRSATTQKYMHITWPDGTSVAMGSWGRARARARSRSRQKLADADAAARVKQYWAERFDTLKEVLASS